MPSLGERLPALPEPLAGAKPGTELPPIEVPPDLPPTRTPVDDIPTNGVAGTTTVR
jgi:hypothetical protein